MKNELMLKGTTTVCGVEIPCIAGGFGEGKRAMLAKDIATLHNKTLYKVNELINNNIKRFKENVDLIDLKGDKFAILLKDSGIFTRGSLNASKNVYLFSERGYAKLIKIFDDDLSWDRYDQLLDEYFEVKEEVNKTGAFITEKASPEMLRSKADELEGLRIAQESTQMLNGLMDSVGIDSKVKLLTAKTIFRKAGIELPIEVEAQVRFYDTKQIAARLNMFTNNGKPAFNAISEILKMIDVPEDEQQAVWESSGSWQGTVIKYAEPVIERAKTWLFENGYPTVIDYTTSTGKDRKYYVVYGEKAVASC